MTDETTITIRLTRADKDLIRSLSEQNGIPMSQVLIQGARIQNNIRVLYDILAHLADRWQKDGRYVESAELSIAMTDFLRTLLPEGKEKTS